MRWIFIALIAFSACSKDKKRCYSCVSYFALNYNYPSLNVDTSKSTPFDQCNMTQSEINGFIERHIALNTTYHNDTIRIEYDSIACSPK